MSAWRSLPKAVKYVILVGAGAGVTVSALYYGYLTMRLRTEVTESDKEKKSGSKSIPSIVAPKEEDSDMASSEILISVTPSTPLEKSDPLKHELEFPLMQSGHVSPVSESEIAGADISEEFMTPTDVSMNEETSNNDADLMDKNSVYFTPETPSAWPKVPSERVFEEDSGESRTSKVERKVLVLGLDHSGKSAILTRLSQGTALDDSTEYSPTKGFNVVCISSQDKDLSIWEIGGAAQFRSYWQNFEKGTDMIIFVVDVSDLTRIQDANDYLSSVAQRTSPNIPILILISKADLLGDAAKNDVRTLLHLDNLVSHKHEIIFVSVKDPDASRNGIADLQAYCHSFVE